MKEPSLLESSAQSPPASREPSSSTPHVHEGLRGIVAAKTRASRVLGDVGRLTIAGFEVGELAPAAAFEAVAHLLFEDRLPNRDELASYRAKLAGARSLETNTLTLLAEAARRRAAPMDALRLGVASLVGEAVSRERLLGVMPSLLATYLRLLAGEAPVAPDPALGQAENFLFQLRGRVPATIQARALETYWNTVIDHGLNASTFTARVIASTGSSLSAAVEGALGALAGPLHGGAPGPALSNFLELRATSKDAAELKERTRAWAESEIRLGRRLMGFGHRVYKVRDPRADVLSEAAQSLLEGTDLLSLARVHETAVLEVLDRLKPGRGIATNVEFYTALLLHGLGFEPDEFTAVFALGRVAGWITHFEEQRQSNHLIRPESLYVGAEGRTLRSPLAAG